MAAAAILVFEKFKISRSVLCMEPICITLPNFVKIGPTVAEIWRFNGFFNGGRPPSWICRARIGTTHEDYLVVFIVVLFGWNRCSTFDNMKLRLYGAIKICLLLLLLLLLLF